jgi:hypothetical protein
VVAVQSEEQKDPEMAPQRVGISLDGQVAVVGIKFLQWYPALAVFHLVEELVEELVVAAEAALVEMAEPVQVAAEPVVQDLPVL